MVAAKANAMEDGDLEFVGYPIPSDEAHASYQRFPADAMRNCQDGEVKARCHYLQYSEVNGQAT